MAEHAESIRMTGARIDARAARTSLPRRAATLLWSGLVAAVLLVAVALAVGTTGSRVLPYAAFPVLSGSMEPALAVGSLAVVRPVRGEELHVGDIVTFHPPHGRARYVTHRIVAARGGDGRRVFVTKGDANGAPDGWVLPAEGAGWRYAASIPYLGYVFGTLSSPFGRLAILALVVLGVSARVLVGIWRGPRDEAG